MDAPLITIFVRHSAGCKYAGDEFTKRCNCKKHVRWSQNGRQHRLRTGSRSWAGAEEKKRELEAQLSGRPSTALDFPSGTRYGRAIEARYPSGKGEVCKTFMRGLDSHPRLQHLTAVNNDFASTSQIPALTLC